MIKLQILSLLLFSSFSLAQTSLRYEGYIENSGTPVNAAAQNFTVRIMNPICATALISSSATADIIDGEFNIAPSFADAALFSNIMSPTYVNGSCPTPSTNRTFRIEWNAQTFDIAMNDAARSSFSNATAKLGERSQDQFLKVDTNTGYTPLSTANVTTLLDIIAGTNTQYLRPSNAFGGDVAGTYNAISVNRIRGTNVVATTPLTNQVLKYDGTNWAPAADDTGATGDASYVAKGLVQVNTSSAFSGLDLAAGILSMADIGTAGTYGSATQIPVITTDAKGRVTNVVSTALVANDATKLPLVGGTMTGAINMSNNNITNAASIAATNYSGRNFIAYDADSSNTITILTPTNVVANYSLTLPPDDGTVGQLLQTDGNGVLSWITGGGGGTVTSVSSMNSYITVTAPTTAPVLTANVGTAPGTLAAGDDSRIVNALQIGGETRTSDINIGTNDMFNLNLETNGAPRIVIDAVGNVGVNTPSPNSIFDINGDLAMRGISTPSFSNPGEGRIYYDSGMNRFRVSENSGSYEDLLQTPNFGLGAFQTPQVGGTPMSSNGVVLSNATNTGLITLNCTMDNVIKFDVSGFAYCATDNSAPATTILSGGNTFGTSVLIGSNDNTNLEFETNNTIRMRIFSNGNIEQYRSVDTIASSGYGNAPAGQGRIYFDSTSNKYKVSESGSDFQDLVSVRFPVDSMPGSSIALGLNALSNQIGAVPRNNIAIGYQSMSSPSITTGATNNVAIGRGTLSSITNGAYNVAIGGGNAGQSPLGFITLGSSNVAVGANAASSSTTGSFNTAIGRSAMAFNTTGQNNTFVGYEAGVDSTSQSDTALGASALMNSQSGFNTAIGRNALVNVMTGSDNVALGFEAGASLMGGSSNVFIGPSVGTSMLTSGNNNILIGTSSSVDTPTTNTNDHLNIGNTIYGNLASNSVGIGTSNPTAMLDVNGPVRLGNGSSIMSRMIFCSPSVTLSAGIVNAGDSINLQTGNSSCPGIQSGMVVNCSWVSESAVLGRLSWSTVAANSTDETNQAIRIRFTNNGASGTLPVTSSTLGLACVAFRP